MEGSGGNIPGVQTLLNAFVHLLRRLATKRQQQDLIGDGLARCQQPPRPRDQYGRFAAPGPREHQQRLFAVNHGASLGRIQRRRLHRTEEIGIAGEHFVSPRLVMRQPALVCVAQPGLTLSPGVTAIIKLIETRHR